MQRRKRLILGFGFIILFLITIILNFFKPCLFHKPKVNLTSVSSKQTFLFGLNYPWGPVNKYGHDFGVAQPWNHDGVSANSLIEKQFEDLHNSGVKLLLWHIFGDGRASPEIDSLNLVLGFDDYFFKDLDTAFAIAEENDISLLLVLVDFKWFGFHNENDSVQLGGRANVLLDSLKRKSFFDNALKPLLKRYGKERYLAGWIIINEPEQCLEYGIDITQIKEFVQETRIKGFLKKRIVL